MLDYKTIFDERGKSYNFAHEIAPLARRDELESLLDATKPKEGETIVVTAAGGGFDAAGIYEATLPRGCNVICVEPCEEFASYIPEHLLVHQCSVDCIPIASHSVDAVVNLAAMHHSINPVKDITEWTRLLKPAGRLVIADVQVDTNPARFLNDAVDRWNPSGHRGNFIVPGFTTALLRSIGQWSSIEEYLADYQWRFHDTTEMIRFTKNLFGMTLATDDDILKEIDCHLGTNSEGSEFTISFPWCLRFIVAVKA